VLSCFPFVFSVEPAVGAACPRPRFYVWVFLFLDRFACRVRAYSGDRDHGETSRQTRKSFSRGSLSTTSRMARLWNPTSASIISACFNNSESLPTSGNSRAWPPADLRLKDQTFRLCTWLPRRACGMVVSCARSVVTRRTNLYFGLISSGRSNSRLGV